MPKYCCSKCYHLSTRNEPIVRTCKYCGKEVIINPKHKNKTFCDVKCSSAFRKDSSNHRRWIGKNGYVNFWDNDKGIVKEHIYIMEQAIGRKLKKNEVVHHIDFNRSNNDISNLQLMTRAEHSALHRKIEIEKNGYPSGLINPFKRTGMKPYNCKPVKCIENGKIYLSTGDCAKDICGNAKCIWKVCTGKMKTYKGLHFEYVNYEVTDE